MLARQEAAAELLRRRVIQGDFTEWCRLNGYEPARHHRLLIEELEAVARGENDRLMVFMPPGSAKSTYVSLLFVPWFMARFPEHMVVAASHTQSLADRWGRKCRNLVAEHGNVLGIALSDDSTAADKWALASGAEYFATGVGGSVTGRRADLIVIDDPVRSREDADSEVIREKVDDWFRSDLQTRLKPGGRVIVVQTRWHEDDLSGRLLERMKAGGRQWRVISLPAIAGADDALGRAPGEALWPEWQLIEDLEAIRQDMLPREWSALYQQNPVPDDGDYFKADWIKTVPTLPDVKSLRVHGASDYAVTSKGGDYTVHIVVGIDPEQRIYVLDLWRGQTASDVWIEAYCDLICRWKPISWGVETGQINSGVGPFLFRRAVERSAWTAQFPFASRTDKSVRAQSIRGRIAMKGLYIAADAPWKADFVSELLSFPAGKHDDQVDALGLVGQLLDHANGWADKENKPKVPDRLEYTAMPDGSIRANMSVMQIVERKMKLKGTWR